jgi:hypothetical protein
MWEYLPCALRRKANNVIRRRQSYTPPAMAIDAALSLSLSLSLSLPSELFFKSKRIFTWLVGYIYTCVSLWPEGWTRRRAFITDCHGAKIPVHVLAYTHVVEAKQRWYLLATSVDITSPSGLSLTCHRTGRVSEAPKSSLLAGHLIAAMLHTYSPPNNRVSAYDGTRIRFCSSHENHNKIDHNQT